jgi:hypothetical protein
MGASTHTLTRTSIRMQNWPIYCAVRVLMCFLVGFQYTNVKLVVLRHPIMHKYRDKLDIDEFVTGAKQAVLEVIRNLQSDEFVKYCKW